MMRLQDTGELIDDHQYPATSDELIELYGDRVIELQNGEETVAEILGRLGPETYEGPADVHAALRTGASHKAIGRRFYSDREPPSFSEWGPTQQSF